MSKSVANLISAVRHQLPSHVTTWGKGTCGHSARGCRRCIACLERDLAEIVGEALAYEYVTSEKNLRSLVRELYDKEIRNE